MSKFTGAQIKYLKSQRLGRLATLRPDGTLQNNPVGFTFIAETGTFEIGGLNMGGSQKYKNVVANGQVAFVVDDLESVEPWKPRMVEVRGTAEPVPNDDPRRSTILIHPNRVISFGIEESRELMTGSTTGLWAPGREPPASCGTPKPNTRRRIRS
jgi:pyridoxamine 5'-phosphate oxidase family protein